MIDFFNYIISGAFAAGLLYQAPIQQSAWSPKSEGASCSFWLDPTDNSTITQASNLVSNWADKCHNAYNWTASSNKFTVTAAAVNSLQAMASTGTTGMTGPAQMFVATGSAWTFAMAGKLTAYNSHAGTMILFSDGGGVNKVYQVSWNDSTQTGYVGLDTGEGTCATFGCLLYNKAGGLSTGSVFKIVITYSGSSPTSTGSYTISFNGISETVTTNPGGWNTGLALAGTIIGGLGAFSGFGMSGFFGDLMFFNEQSAGLTTNINTYLARWGV